MKRWLSIAGAVMLAATMGVACTFSPRGASSPAARGAAPATGSINAQSIEERAAAIKAAAQRSDHESDSKVRAALASEASNNADAKFLSMSVHS